jgi:hypothetical protein
MQKTVATLALLTLGNCWWNQGHMIVAKIAEDELSKKHPEVWDRVNSVLKLISTKEEKDHKFVESATFADVYNFKMYGEKGKVDPYLALFEANKDLVNTDAHWHYTNKPYFEDIKPEEAEGAGVADLNIVVALQRLQDNLKGLEMTPEVSYRIRCLIHYIGDLH